MRTVLALTVSAVLLGVTACGEAEQPAGTTSAIAPQEISTDQLPAGIGPYPRTARGSFLDSCGGEAPPKQCQCALAYLEDNVPLSELVAAGFGVQQGEAPGQLADAIAECASRMAG